MCCCFSIYSWTNYIWKFVRFYMLVMGEIRLHQRRWNMFPLQHASVSKIPKDSQKEYVHNYFPRLTFPIEQKRNDCRRLKRIGQPIRHSKMVLDCRYRTYMHGIPLTILLGGLLLAFLLFCMIRRRTKNTKKDPESEER